MPVGKKSFSQRDLLSSTGLLMGLALLKLLLHLATNHNLLGYGYFRDELYYMVCAERLDFGYVDHPPLAPLILNLNRQLLGDSLFALRLLPAVAGAATVLLTGLMVRQLGGSRRAQCLAALAVIFAPVLLIINGFFSMNAFEVLLWTSCAYLLLLLLKTDRPQLWLPIGLVAGLGLQNKHTMLIFGLGMAVGLTLTPARKHLRSKWLWLGGAIAFLIFLPNLVWQVRHGWPSLEFYANANLFKNIPTSPQDILLTQILALNPVALPIWLAGLGYYLFAREGKPYRMMGWLYLVLLLALIASRSSRPDRIAGAYPMLLAAGAVAIERAIQRLNRPRLAWAAMTVLILGGTVLMPIGIPVLPPEATARYTAALGLTDDLQIERDNAPPLPQYFADRFGWQEMVATIAEVYASLPPEEQAKATILTSDYGKAGAIDVLGRAYGLPRAISGHNNYYLWGAEGASGEVVISTGLSGKSPRSIFDDVKQVATVRCDHCLENGSPVYLARHPRLSIDKVWPHVKHYG